MTDIYQSPGDRLRFEILLKSLTEGSLNLAVLSDHDQVLDFYGKLFDQRLRAQGETQIEFCASTNSEQLVKKFNEILSELTLNQALEKDKKHAPRRYLVFRDSILMQDFELQLLARLVNGFPAGNISVILLLNRSANYRSKLEAFGKNLLQWEVETQAGEAKKPLENWVAEAPKPTWRVPGSDTPKQEPVLLPELSREPTLLAEVVPPPQAPEPAMVFARPARKTPWGLITLVVLLSLAAYGYMYRDVLLSEVELMKKYLLRGTPAVATPAEDAASAAAVSAQALASADALQVAASAALAASVAEPAAASSASAVVTPVLAPEPAASAAVVVASSAVASAKPLDKASDKPVASKPTEPKTSSEATDEEWLKQLPPNSWVVQLAAFDTEKEVLAFQRSHKLYANARVMTPRKKSGDKRYFILVSGPFVSKSEADAYMQSSPLLGKAWLRGSQSLKTQFE